MRKNIVVGTEVSLNIPIFKGYFKNAKFVREAKIERAVCVREVYGDKGKHWFTFEILESNDSEFKVGDKKRLQGKNAYGCCDILNQPSDVEVLTALKNDRKGYLGYA